MATNSDRRNAGADTRTAGGKIMRLLRTPSASRTPYARPSKSPADEQPVQEPANPNWLSNLIYPVKIITSGARNIFSFFRNDSLSSSEDDSESDDDEVYEVENDGSNQVFSPANKSHSKRRIDQLVMEETFSREEGEQLIRLIRSRIMDTNVNFGTLPAKDTAIMEARKWLQEKRSTSKKELEAELDLTSSQFARKDKGSPADMAKSYMQNCPTWSSPSKQLEFGSPTLDMLHFKEETPTSTLRKPELKRSSFDTESWNLVDEIRRVRTKATEDLLATTPLMKTNLSIFSPANNQDNLEKKGNIEVAGPAGSTHGRHDRVLDDAVATSFVRNSQVGNAVQSVELQERPEAVDVSVVNFDKDIKVIKLRSATPENGFVAPGHVQGQNAADEPRPSNEENGNLIASSSPDGQDVPVENPNLLTEPNESTFASDPILNRSQNNSSMQEEDLFRLQPANCR